MRDQSGLLLGKRARNRIRSAAVATRSRRFVHGVQPIDQGAIADDPTLASIDRRHGATAAQIALAWIIRHPDVVAIPKAVRKEHLQANINAARIALTAEDLAQIDARYPPPRRKSGLSMI